MEVKRMRGSKAVQAYLCFVPSFEKIANRSQYFIPRLNTWYTETHVLETNPQIGAYLGAESINMSKRLDGAIKLDLLAHA